MSNFASKLKIINIIPGFRDDCNIMALGMVSKKTAIQISFFFFFNCFPHDVLLPSFLMYKVKFQYPELKFSQSLCVCVWGGGEGRGCFKNHPLRAVSEKSGNNC